MQWFVFALLSALFAGLVTIFAKIGLKTIDSSLVAIIRSIFVVLTLLLFGVFSGKLSTFSPNLFWGREGVFIILSGVAGAISWLFYFWALGTGNGSQVASIDKLSLVFIVLFSAVFLAEKITWQVILGAILMISGAVLISWPH
ncbi:MAG: hypothetical protein UU61_C0004G0008 [Parcubacteria group bacterium GW2011_GWB1_41_4]|nr:MAG: hypothetical protein UU61_C0004G0008 [Parcubacteria group bacterium GW2011_GWB1_41_4]